MTTAGVSQAELDALIASLTTAPTPAAAEPENIPAAIPAAASAPVGTQLGPWISARYKGDCAGCGTRFDALDQIRADGEGGWLAECCGRDSETGGSLEGIVAAAPPVAAGPPPSTVKELRSVLMDFEAARPRTMQVALGPSELGTPCQQQIARKLVGAPRRPIKEPTWAPFQGTAVHRSMEDVVAFWNAQLGRERWLAEDRLTVDPGLPGEVDPIEGSGDAFDCDYDMVVDWKHTGTTAREKILRGRRMNKPLDEWVSAEYRIQAHLYGLGHERKGRTVRWVRLVLLARSHDYDESAEWTEAYQPEIAYAAIDRYYRTHDLINTLGGPAIGDLVSAVPATPHRDTCKWCPFARPGQPSTWDGCPGDRPLDKVIDNATAGLIAPTPRSNK